MDHKPVHQTILVVDVQGFGRLERNDLIRAHLRATLYPLLESSMQAASVDLIHGRFEDRGDGCFVTISAEVPKQFLAGRFPYELKAGLDRYNDRANEKSRMRLRVGLHAGEVAFDTHGKVGMAVNHAFRLVDCKPLREALESTPANLALIVSDSFYREVIWHDPGLSPQEYRPVNVQEKELNEGAWINDFSRRGPGTPGTGGQPAKPPSGPSQPHGGGTIVFHGPATNRDVIAGNPNINNWGVEP